MREMEIIQRLVKTEEAVGSSPEFESLKNLILSKIKDESLRNSYERIKRGLETEDEYKPIFQEFPWIKELSGIDQNQTSEQKKEYQLPDYKMLIENNSGKLFQIFIDVKSVRKECSSLEICKNTVLGLKKYAKMNNSIIVFAIFWGKYNGWTHNCIDNFVSKKRNYTITMEEAFKNDLSSILGDHRLLLLNKIYRKTIYNKSSVNENTPTHIKYGPIDNMFISYDNRNWKELSIINSAIIDSAIKLKEVKKLKNDSLITQYEESNSSYMMKISSWLPAILKTFDISEVSDETIEGYTYGKIALYLLDDFIKELHLQITYTIPNNTSETSDILFREAFNNSSIYRQYLMQKLSESRELSREESRFLLSGENIK